MRFEVPQFIEVESKIFGPLTWRQLVYLGGGIGIAVVLFFWNIFLFLFFGLPIAILAGALAFYPVNNRPFVYFLEAIFSYLGTDKTYLWRRKDDTVYKAPAREGSNTSFTPTNTYSSSAPTNPDVNSLARKLELEALQKTE